MSGVAANEMRLGHGPVRPPCGCDRRTLVLACPRCGAEVRFRVDAADVEVRGSRRLDGTASVFGLTADVDLSADHTCGAL